MIMCDRCNEWFHFKCMNIPPEEIPAYTNDEKQFFCGQKNCVDKNRNKKKTKKIPDSTKSNLVATNGQ